MLLQCLRRGTVIMLYTLDGMFMQLCILLKSNNSCSSVCPLLTSHYHLLLF